MMKCDTSDCKADSTFQIARLDSRQLALERHLCDAHAQALFEEFRSNDSIGRGEPFVMPGSVCVDFELIAYRQSFEDRPAFIYLHEVGGKRRFATMIDGWTWWTLATLIRKQATPRPVTHSAWSNTIKALGGTLQDVIVDTGIVGTSWYDTWYDAKLRIVKEDRLRSDIDVRASDAYILALLHGVPIFVTERLLQRAVDTGQ